jgi:polyhydroxybutyrate depolymerase
MKSGYAARGVGAITVCVFLGCSSQASGPGSSAHPARSSSGVTSTSPSSGAGSSGSQGGIPTSGASASGVSSESASGASGAPGTTMNGGSGSNAATSDGGSEVIDDAGTGPGDAAASPDANTMSAGCGTTPMQTTANYVQYNINVTTGLAATYVAQYTARNYYVWLPPNYDPTRAYTTVFLGPGCGGNGESVLPMQNASTSNAILVGLSPVGQCFMTSAADSPEIAFFDAVLSTVESTFCVDKAHVFIAGFSSGSWLSNLIGCARAGIVRGQGNATGGLPPVPTCAGPIAAMLAHDEGDPANNISGGEAARDRILKINGCSLTETMPYDAGRPSMCVQYQGCPAAYPVVWCPTTGQGHSDQVATGLSVPGFWNFWEALPYVSPPQ